MPRPPRLVVPDVPLHITQRGVDRGPTFLIPEDFAFYHWALKESAVHAECAVHAYALMNNHVHLLLTPADVFGPARLMESLGRRYVRYFNDRYRRTGTLWEGRFRSAVVGTTAYLFACSRYVELNPVRAGLVDEPSEWIWSSFRCNALGHVDTIVTPRPEYDALGVNREARLRAYRALCGSELSPSDVATIRADVRGRPKLHPTSYQQLVASAAEQVARRRKLS